LIKFYFKLNGYTKKKISNNIDKIEVIDRVKLQDGIDTFQKELNWSEMWSVDDAEKRLENGWWFYVIEINNKYVGWSWFDNDTRKFCNVYVHEKYRNNGYGKDLVYVRLNECKRQGIEKVWMEVEEWNVPIQKIGQELGWSPKIHYTFWSGGFDSTYHVLKSLVDGKMVQPIYIDDRAPHGGYHSNPLINQRNNNDDLYPRKSTEIELERIEWFRKKIYKLIKNSEKLLLPLMNIHNPIQEDNKISEVVKKYNEWLPETIYKTKNGDDSWLEAQADIVIRFQKQFGLEIEYPIEHIENDWYEILDCAIEDGKFYEDRLPLKYQDLKIFGGFSYPSRHLTRGQMFQNAKKHGFDELMYYTWTCWYPKDDKPCNECKICKERIIECRSIGDTI
tara:strand:- start:783 stop:1955 length:1173 start_codon:yes stop_codon:yes gene_type:complete